MSQVYQTAGNFIGSHPEYSQQFKQIQNVAWQYLGLANAEEQMHYRPSHVATNADQYDFPTTPFDYVQRVHARGGRNDHYFDQMQNIFNAGSNPAGTSSSTGGDNQNFYNIQSSIFGEGGSSSFNQGDNQGSNLGFSQFSTLTGGFNQDFYTPPQNPNNPIGASEFSNNFMNLFMTQNTGLDSYTGQQTQRLISPIRNPNFDVSEPSSQVHQEDVNVNVNERPRRRHRPRGCGTHGRLGRD